MLILDNYTVQQTGKQHLELTFEVVVTAEQAEQHASQWAQDEITMHLIGKTPTFVLLTAETGYDAVWRVPLELRLPRKGAFAVTEIDLSAVTGEIIDAPATKQRVLDVLEEEVRLLVEQAPTRPRPKISQAYLDQFAPMPQPIAN